MDETYDYIEIIRNYINHPRINYHLRKKENDNFNQVYSCMDVMGDVASAINVYLKSDFGIKANNTENIKDGTNYIICYGILQALILQQDAVENIASALKLKTSIYDSKALLEVREVRNKCIGHPTRKNRSYGKKSIPTFHYISRPTLNKFGFQLLSSDQHSDKFESISIKSLLEVQKKEIIKILDNLCKEIKKIEKDYKMKYKSKSLKKIIFEETYLYRREKLFSFSHNPHSIEKIAFGKFGFDAIKNSLNEVKQEMSRRNYPIESIDTIQMIYNYLEYPLSKIESCLNEKEKLDDELYFILISFIDQQINELGEILDEIDKDFSEIN